MFYAIAVRRLVASYVTKIVAIAVAAASDFAKEEVEEVERTDAKGKDKAKGKDDAKAKSNAGKAKKVSSHMRTVARRALKYGLAQLESRSQQAADRARAHSKRELGRLGLVVKKEPELKHLIDGWRKDNVEKITGLADEHVDRIERILAEGFNKKPETIVRQIQALGIMSDRRAEMIARDQILTLNSKINRWRQLAAGVESFVWTTQNDERVRDEHAEIDGETFSWEEGHPEEGFPGEPINCFPGSTRIARADGVKSAFRYAYRGELTALVTDSGETFECTPNHPVLTASGWKPAHAIDIGEYVFDVREKMPCLSERNDENRYPSLAETFDALSLVWNAQRIDGRATQFHGDGSANEKIDVVRTHGGLLLQDDPAFAENVRKAIFSEALVRSLPFSRERALTLGLVGVGLPPTGLVRCFGNRLALFERRLRKAGYVGFGSIPGALDAGAHEEVRDCLARYPEAFGEALYGGTLPIELEALFFREAFGVMRRTVVPKRPNAPSAESLGETVRVTRERGGDLSEKHSLFEHPRRVVQKRVREFSGHVFDLETSVGWYSTGYLNSNCRCIAFPIAPEKGAKEEEEDE